MTQRIPDFIPDPASYRDPSGFVFRFKGQIYRQVNRVYEKHYRHFISSGLYGELAGKRYLVSHQEINQDFCGGPGWLLTLKPETIPVISYPYEWSFDMLKDAALLTIEINTLAMRRGMILKDATPFNIQFRSGKAVFIDSLSFELYDETKPWIAYRQFCESFLFPLYLGHYTKTDAQQWLLLYPEGLTADTTSRLLPVAGNFNLGTWLHVFLQRRIQGRRPAGVQRASAFSSNKLRLVMEGLSVTIRKLRFSRGNSTWSNYYTESIAGNDYLQAKEAVFTRMISGLPVHTALDLGANDGYFSKLLAGFGLQVIAIDADSACINRLYNDSGSLATGSILPLLADLSNPSPASGFNNAERASFSERMVSDLVVALALSHHLAITKNIPFSMLAEMFCKMGRFLVIEFVPKEDPRVQELLRNKTDIHDSYHEAAFREAFSVCYTIRVEEKISGTARTLYLMERK